MATTEALREEVAAAAAEGAPEPGEPLEALIATLSQWLAEARERAAEEPVHNPIENASIRIFRAIRDGTIDDALLARLVQRLTAEAFRARAARIAAYLGELDPEANAERLRRLFARLLVDGEGNPLGFEEVRARLASPTFGFVFTAHPTFSLAERLQELLLALALGRDEEGRPLDAAKRAALLAEIETVPHRPDADLSLEAEQARALRAVARLASAIRRAHGILADLLAEAFPDRWTGIRPRLVTVASWVGYDIDGRADIGWARTLARRLSARLVQLVHYRDTLAALRGRLGPDDPASALLDLAVARLTLAVRTTRERIGFFENLGTAVGREREAELAAVSRDMVEHRAVALADRRELLDLLGRALAAVRDGTVRRELWVLAAEVEGAGLAAAGTHLRINALQLHNAVRHLVGLRHAPDDPTWRLTYLEAIADRCREVEPANVHFGSLLHEKATARRMLMLCAQMLKFVDAGEPIRLLIAECETAFTILSALYLARLFGIDDRIDISPLFETRKALERGAAILDEALACAPFAEYVRRRGRLCIETGFSDAGRYMGQTAASVAIERIRIGVAEVLAKHGLTDVELVVFDTHGESIGRGAHPDSLADRLLYYDTPWSRSIFARHGIRQREEVSFQGGDGYLFFLRDETAFAVLCRCLEHRLEPLPAEPDPFYDERGYVDEFFAAIRQFNRRLLDDPCYATFLGTWGTGMLYPTGSRAVRRQHERSGPANLEHPSQLRAIPHNAILHQLGILVHVTGGVGQAIAKDPAAFARMYRESPRFRRLMTMVEHAFKFTDPQVTRAYIDLWDAEAWLHLSACRPDAAHAAASRRVADLLELADRHDRLARVFRFMLRDHLDLASALREHRRRARRAGEEPIAVDPATRDNLHLLHATRLAVLRAMMSRAVEIPDFSDRHAVTHDELVLRIFRLDVEATLELLAEIFPIEEGEGETFDYGEPATYGEAGPTSYDREHALFLRPLARWYELVRRIGTGIVHHVGAVG